MEEVSESLRRRIQEVAYRAFMKKSKQEVSIFTSEK
jgi:hypothetical protein